MTTKFFKVSAEAELPAGQTVANAAFVGGLAAAGVASIALTTDASGKVTGGTWTDTAGASHDVAVTVAPAEG